MKALLLAAGLGTRLRPITDRMPKCLVPIRGKPLLEYWLDLLLPGGIERILVNTHHLAPLMEAFVQRSRWRERLDTTYEPELLGTGGTILANRAYFAGEAFLVGHADNLTLFDVAEFLACHRERPSGVAITMMTFVTDAPRTCGIIVQDRDGIVREFHEKVENPPGNLANGAVYVIEPEVVEYIASLGGPFIDFSTAVLPEFLGRIRTFNGVKYHRDIGNPESLRIAEEEYLWEA